MPLFAELDTSAVKYGFHEIALCQRKKKGVGERTSC